MSGGTLILFSGHSLGCWSSQASPYHHTGVLTKVSTETPRDKISAGLNSPPFRKIFGEIYPVHCLKYNGAR